MSKLKYQSLLDNGFVLSDDKPKPDWNATSGEEAEILNKPDLSIYSQSANLGNILFVSANAPIANDGNTREQAIGRIDKPFRSIQNAVNVASSGDVVYVSMGSYNGFTTNNTFFYDCTIILENVIVNGDFKISSGYGLAKTFTLIGIGKSKITGNIQTPDNSNYLIDNIEFNNYTAPISTLYNANIKNCKINNLQAIACLFENCTINLSYAYRSNSFFHNCQITISTAINEGQFNKLYFEGCNITVTSAFMSIEYYPPTIEFRYCNIVANQFMQSFWGKAGANFLIMEYCKLQTTEIFIQNQIYCLIANFNRSNFPLTSVTPNINNIQNYNIIT